VKIITNTENYTMYHIKRIEQGRGKAKLLLMHEVQQDWSLIMA